MKIFLIRRVTDADDNEAISFVVTAPDVEHARRVAAHQAGREGPGIWWDPQESTVVKIGWASRDAISSVVLRDYVNVTDSSILRDPPDNTWGHTTVARGQ